MRHMEGIRIMSRITSIICSSRRQLGLRREQRVQEEHPGLERRRRRRVGVRLLHHRQGFNDRTGDHGRWVIV